MRLFVIVWIRQWFHEIITRFNEGELILEENPIKQMPLPNNLTLEFIDKSKHVAVDRWLVSVTARIRIPLDELAIGSGWVSVDQAEALKQAVGDPAVYEKEMKRNFIDAASKDRLVDALVTSYIDSSLSYLSTPEFPRKYLLRTLAGIQSRAAWITG